jgi:hypothetical protein
MLAELQNVRDVGCKKNAQGFRETWIGSKLHLDVADGQIPISSVVSSASVHDSQVSILLTKMTAVRITSLYELQDATCCSPIIRQFSSDLGHIPLINHNPRRGETVDLAPNDAQRYKA